MLVNAIKLTRSWPCLANPVAAIQRQALLDLLPPDGDTVPQVNLKG